MRIHHASCLLSATLSKHPWLNVGVVFILQAMCPVKTFGAAVTTIFVDTGTAVLESFAGVPLSGGSPSIDHDGFIVQLGYHSNATVGHEFDGDWIPLTGQGSANTAFAQSTVGDSRINGTSDGEFFDEWSFVVGDSTKGQNLPVAGKPLAFRFFAGTNTFTPLFGEVSNSLWLWPEPKEPPVETRFLYFDDPGLKLASGKPIPANLHIKTDTAPPFLPEPATFVLVISGVMSLASRRRPRRR